MTDDREHLKKTLPGTFVKLKNIDGIESEYLVYKVDFRDPKYPIMAKNKKGEICRTTIKNYFDNKVDS